MYISVFKRFSNRLRVHRFGSHLAVTDASLNAGEAEMAILILEVLVSWSLLAVATGLGLGAAIARGEQVRRDEFLTYVFASLENMQASRG